VQVILGPPFADFGQPLLQTVGGAVPVLFVASTEPVLPDPTALSFLTTFDDTAQAEAAAQFAIDEGFTRAITFSSEGPYFGYNPEVFTEAFEGLGGEVVIDQSYVPFEDFDFSTQANEVANVADGSEILYTAMIADQVVALRGQLEELGVDIAYIGADAFEVTGLAFTDNNEGIYYTTHAFAEPGNRLATFLESFEAATGAPNEAPSFAGLAADAITVAVEGLLRSGSTDPVEIGAAIAEIDTLEAVTGVTGYAGTSGVPNKPVYIHQMIGGEATLAATIGG
jgi:ABC-type branched-subunit amino acid transport system substrate-binding protein